MNYLEPIAPTGPAGPTLVQRRRRRSVQTGDLDLPVLSRFVAPLWGVAQAGVASVGQLVRRAQFGVLPPLDQLPTGPRQSAIRVRGVVKPSRAGAAVRADVVTRAIYRDRRVSLRQASVFTDETTGVDFFVHLPSEETVLVRASDVRLHDPPAPIGHGRRPPAAPFAMEDGPTLVRHVAVRVGDVVEVMGVIVQEVAPSGDASLGRGTPLVNRLAPPPGSTQVWLRVVSRPQ